MAVRALFERASRPEAAVVAAVDLGFVDSSDAEEVADGHSMVTASPQVHYAGKPTGQEAVQSSPPREVPPQPVHLANESMQRVGASVQVDLVTPERLKRPPGTQNALLEAVQTSVKVRKLQQEHCVTPGSSSSSSRPAPELLAGHGPGADPSCEVPQRIFEGYVLRDLRKIVAAMLPRYGHLLRETETRALASFSKLPLRAQQLYARLLGRKWPQWIPVAGLGSKYRELGEEAAASAVAELARALPSEPTDLTAATQQLPNLDDGSQFWSGDAPELLSDDDGTEAAAEGLQLRGYQPPDVAPWLLDTACETVSSLLARPLKFPTLQAAAGLAGAKDNFGCLLLEACPMAKLREFASNLGLAGLAKAPKASKGTFRKQLCQAARQQRLLGAAPAGGGGGRARGAKDNTTEARLISQVLGSGRWVCVAPSPGHEAVMALVDLFHLETSGAPASSFMVFSSRWPGYKLPEASTERRRLFLSRAALDAFLRARRLALQLEDDRADFALDILQTHAATAERELQIAQQNVDGDAFELEKSRCPCRRRFTAAWCWAEALHHSLMRMPALHDDTEARAVKIRRLRVLLQSPLGPSRRGGWYNELAKEVLRQEGLPQALQVAAEGLAEGEPPPLSVRVNVDLTADVSSQDLASPVAACDDRPLLPTDARWELARRCHSLASRSATVARGGRAAGKSAWRLQLRDLEVAKSKAAGGDDGGRWLPNLVDRLLAEEAGALGIVKSISAASQGMATDPMRESVAPSARMPVGGRRQWAGYDLADLSVEELAMRHYLAQEGYDCGVHCEGAILRDLFGVLLFDELFDTSIEGAFVSEFQDGPLDLDSPSFYQRRRDKLESRFKSLAVLTTEEVASQVRHRFALLHGTLIRGVAWDRYVGPCGHFWKSTECNIDESRTNAEVAAEAGAASAPAATIEAPSRSRTLWTAGPSVPSEAGTIAAVAAAIGGCALAHACRMLCQDYTSAGLPDLLLWSWPSDGKQPRARFVEVKSERDVLARRQRAWLAALRAGGAEAEVCHVRDDCGDTGGGADGGADDEFAAPGEGQTPRRGGGSHGRGRKGAGKRSQRQLL